MKKAIKITLAFATLIFVACGNSGNESGKSEKEGKSAPETVQTNSGSPIQQLFSSMESLKSNLVGMVFVSANDDCMIDFRRENRFKVFIKETPGGEWKQFNGEKYRVTYSGNDLCIEMDDLDGYEDNNARGVFTPAVFTLNYKRGGTLTFKDFRIVTADEGRQLYERG